MLLRNSDNNYSTACITSRQLTTSTTTNAITVVPDAIADVRAPGLVKFWRSRVGRSRDLGGVMSQAASISAHQRGRCAVGSPGSLGRQRGRCAVGSPGSLGRQRGRCAVGSVACLRGCGWIAFNLNRLALTQPA